MDLVVITPTGHIGNRGLSALLAAGGVARIAVGRPIDLLVTDPGQLEINHLLSNALAHARLLVGPAVAVKRPEPAAWALQARQFAEDLVRHGDSAQQAAGVLWAAAARLVESGAPAPARKDDAAEIWAEQVRGRWVDLLMRAHTGRQVGRDECTAFLEDVRPVALGPRRRRRGRGRGRGGRSQPTGTAA
nr:hypothetical protein [Micromonospora veneta]